MNNALRETNGVASARGSTKMPFNTSELGANSRLTATRALSLRALASCVMKTNMKTSAKARHAPRINSHINPPKRMRVLNTRKCARFISTHYSTKN